MKKLTHYLVLVHRYLGIALGLIIALWCLSGFVMMFVQYPDFSYAEELSTAAPLKLDDCCTTPDLDSFSEIAFEHFYIVMRPSGQILYHESREQYGFDLTNGDYLWESTRQDADALIRQYAEQNAAGTTPEFFGLVESDQWTVAGYFNSLRPFYTYDLHDDPGTRLYVSTTTGEIAQQSTAQERFWNWPGAVIHWIYFTPLRKNTALWADVVIWLTIFSLFLTIIGFYVGIARFRFKAKRRKSPFGGWMLWHHYTGLIFGVLILTWLFSGLISMQPWGLTESRSFVQENRNLKGVELRFDQNVRDIIGTIPSLTLPPDTVRIEANAFNGELRLVARRSDGEGELLDAIPLVESMPVGIAERLRPNVPVTETGLLENADLYYYSHHNRVSFPVYRIRYEDGEIYYIDPVSGRLVRAVDAGHKSFRWLHLALHRGDFAAILRERPLWYWFLGVLLAAATFGVITGVYIGFRRVIGWIR